MFARRVARRSLRNREMSDDGRRHILLIGAGHAHLNVIRDSRRWPRDAVRLTVAAPGDFWYSGLATGVLGGQHPPEQDRVGVADLCRRVGAEFVDGELQSLDADARRATLCDGTSLDYDVASLNLGSVSRGLPGAEADGESIFTAKPISMLPKLRRRLEGRDGDRVVVVGGGYSGSECALNLAALPGRRDVTLLTRGDRPAKDLPRRVSATVAKYLRGAGVTIRTDTPVDCVEGREVVTEAGERVPFDVLLVATGLKPPPIIGRLGLETDDSGALVVDEHLRCRGRENLFAGGDSTNFAGKELAKIGVTAVFQGRVLRHNLPAAATGGNG